MVTPLGLKILSRAALKNHQNIDDLEDHLPHSISSATTIIINEYASYEETPTGVQHDEKNKSMKRSLLEESDSSAGETPPRKVHLSKDFFPSNQSLRNLLMSTSKVKTLIRLYEQKSSFNNMDCRKLVQIIIDAMLDRHCSVRSNMFKEVANEIITEFPKESAETYFSYNQNVSKNPRSKLVDRYKSE